MIKTRGWNVSLRCHAVDASEVVMMLVTWLHSRTRHCWRTIKEVSLLSEVMMITMALVPALALLLIMAIPLPISLLVMREPCAGAQGLGKPCMAPA